MKFRFAENDDLPKIRNLLMAVNLPYQDIDRHITNFLLIEKDAELSGVLGLEILGNVALLRSLAVKKTERNNGIGKTLIDKIKSYAQLNNVEKLYLLTTAASDYFQKIGFVRIDREQAPSEIKNTDEFKYICPLSAVCMMQEIVNDVKFCTKDVLRLKEDVPGAKMWGISLNKTMFTYFEVQPDSVFDSHTHESEQITMVLEGVLYFDVNGKIYPVTSGEVIAIPSNIIHSVFTKESYAKAVDAWSPIMNKYK